MKSRTSTTKLATEKLLASPVRPSSGATRDALTTTQCGVTTLENHRAWAAKVVMDVNRKRGRQDALTVDLLLFSGCRVSEVLGLRAEDILSNNQVLIHGAKGGEDRLCTMGCVTDLLDLKYRYSWMFEPPRNRWYVYRLCKEFGIYETVKGNTRAAVTHSGRHQLIADLKEAGVDPREIQRIMGHRSLNSTLHYLKHHPELGFVGYDKRY